MADPSFKKAGVSTTSSIDNKKRKVVKAKAAPVCWMSDYKKEVAATATEKYYKRTLLNGNPDRCQGYVRYTLHLPCKSSSAPLLMEVKLFARPVVNAINDMVHLSDLENPKVIARLEARRVAIEKIKRDCESGVDEYLNGKLKLLIDDPICGKKTLPIRVAVVWVESEAESHYIFKIHGQEIRANVNQNVISVWLGDDHHTHAHEIAHCLGLPDEYSYGPKPVNVQYIKPDGQLGDVVLAQPDGHESLPATLSIMNEGTDVKHRHGWPFAIEAQELLRGAIGERIKCDIQLA